MDRGTCTSGDGLRQRQSAGQPEGPGPGPYSLRDRRRRGRRYRALFRRYLRPRQTPECPPAKGSSLSVETIWTPGHGYAVASYLASPIYVEQASSLRSQLQQWSTKWISKIAVSHRPVRPPNLPSRKPPAVSPPARALAAMPNRIERMKRDLEPTQAAGRALMQRGLRGR